LRDRGGRSFGEAEVEFSTKSAALDCIAQLDNQLVDGKNLKNVHLNLQFTI
jgi:RNA recognition motif-containing protein